MPKVSRRGSNFFESPIRKLVPFAEKAKSEGTKVFHLNIGQPDIPTPPVGIAAVKNADFNILEYSHSAGFKSYREKLVSYYRKFDINVTSNDILITTGASEAILFVMMSCLNEGDEVIVPEPFYANYLGFSQAAGIHVKAITKTIEKGFSLPDIAEIEEKIGPRTRAFMICNPSNPTGYVYTNEELNIIKQLCIKYDLFLFADEVYREFCYDEQNKYSSVLCLEGLEKNVVVLDSISKRYSACGARIGMIVSRNPEVINTVLKFAQSRLSPPTMAQILGEAMLDLPESYIEEVTQVYKNRRDVLIRRLNAMDGVLLYEPMGAFYVFTKLPIDDSDKFCQWLLESFSYKGQTVMLSPGTGFYTTPGMGIHEVRIAYVLNEKDLETAMDVLEVALKQYPGRISSKQLNLEKA